MSTDKLVQGELRMETIKRYIEASVRTGGCNLECSYCYLRQANFDLSVRKEKIFDYPLETILKACSVERIGVSLFNIVGTGETLFPLEVLDLVVGLIDDGHYISLVTNGTIVVRIKELVNRLKASNKQDHIVFLLSMHYTEMKKKKLLNQFFETVNYLQEENISFSVRMILGEDTLEASEEIRELCMDKMGTYPQVAIARKDNPDGTFGIDADCPVDKYYSIGDKYDSKLFELDKEAFRHKRKEFCYAGKYLFRLDFSTGRYSKCLSNLEYDYNFFENIDRPPVLEPVGHMCDRPYCSCCNFLAWGVIREERKYTSEEIYNRREKEWLKYPIYEIMQQDIVAENQIPLLTDIEKKEYDKKNILTNINYKKSLLLKIYYHNKEYDKLIQEAETILEVGKNYNLIWMVETVVLYGNAKLSVGDIQGALNIAKYVDAMGNYADYCVALGYICMENEMFQEAISMYDKATQCIAHIDEGMNSYIPNYNIGVIYECLGKKEEAKSYYGKCGNYKPAQDGLARLENK